MASPHLVRCNAFCIWTNWLHGMASTCFCHRCPYAVGIIFWLALFITLSKYAYYRSCLNFRSWSGTNVCHCSPMSVIWLNFGICSSAIFPHTCKWLLLSQYRRVTERNPYTTAASYFVDTKSPAYQQDMEALPNQSGETSADNFLRHQKRSCELRTLSANA